MSVVVAIHQPNFYPWLGFFDKWRRSDIFVLLDDVQFPKTGGSWTNRCGILHQGQRSWFTAPIDRKFHGTRTIQEMKLFNEPTWRKKLMRKFEHCYASAPNREDARGVLAADLLGSQSHLLDLNLESLTRMGEILGLDREKIVLSSSLGISETATDRLVRIVRGVNGDVYLSGGGASGYQRDERFADVGIELKPQEFKHPVYSQSSAAPFVSGLSILDALCHFKTDEIGNLLRGVHFEE